MKNAAGTAAIVETFPAYFSPVFKDMADFGKYAPFLSEWEGGYVENRNDLGGATNRGVTLRTYRSFFGSDKTKDDLRRMTDAEWRRIMVVLWEGVCADMIEAQSTAEMLADWFINAGINAVIWSQRALGVGDDGIVGPRTMERLNEAGAFEKIYEARKAYYRHIAEVRPANRGFLEGWLNRTEKLYERWTK